MNVQGNASLDLEGVGSDGVDGPPQALDGSVVAGVVGAMDTLADIATAVVCAASRVLSAAWAPAVGAKGAAPVAEGAGDTEQRIRRTVPGLPRGILTVSVLKSQWGPSKTRFLPYGKSHGYPYSVFSIQ